MVTWQIRMLNFVLDTSIYLVFMIGIIFLCKDIILQEDIKWISLWCYFFYYFLFEFFGGQTIGKRITKSKVESRPDQKMSYFLQILLRTLMRFIIIDPISYLFTKNGFHDAISKTTVVFKNKY